MSIKRFSKFLIIAAVVFAVFFALVSPAFAKETTSAETKRAVPFSEVNVNKGFMHNYMKLVICEVIPTAIANVEQETGGMPNIINCARWHKGEAERKEHKGAIYVDSDVHKVLESMCMALDTPSEGDADIEKAQADIMQKLEQWIPYYQWAPEQNGDYAGYFDSYWSLDPKHVKYSNTDQHELYCQGHFIEAAVAHYRYSKHKDATPDTRLLDVAVKSADHITKTFGTNPGQRKQIPGHEEIELALIKLAKLCQEIGGDYAAKANGYIDTAAFFLSVRGDYENRTVDDTQDKRIYYQDHALVENQTEGVGHAVRAQYLYTGMCELASINPEYAAKYDFALRELWDNVTNKKQYVTGGIGDQSNSNEGFAGPYFLPNYSSYCETCAGVANMLWNRSMSILYDGSKYANQIETDLYNNVLGCVNFDGNKFYYENRICTKDTFNRSDWFGTACCPPNFTRTILQVGGYVYNTTDNDIFLNQYVSNEANFSFGSNKVKINMNSNFPYQGNGELTIYPENTGNFNLYLRMPSWSDNFQIKVNGSTISPKEKDGYLVITGQTWQTSGTKIEFNFDMPIKYVTTDSRIETNQGLAALRHGPLFYCSEECDNKDNLDFNKTDITQNGTYNFEKVDSLDGKPNPYGVRTVYTLKHEGGEIVGNTTRSVTWNLIPYYARCNRDNPGGMHLFFHDGNQYIKTHQKATASASRTCVRDSTGGLNDCTNDKEIRWTSYRDDKVVDPNPWVQYNFESPINFNAFRIWWYDDGGGVRLPDSFTFEVRNTQTNTYKTINSNDIIETIDDGNYKIYIFNDTYTGDEIQLTMINEVSQHAPGIVEWEIVDTKNDTYHINFNMNGHGVTAPADQEKKFGEKIDPVLDPSELGCTFEGWFSDPECKNQWDFNTNTVKANMTLYAKWTLDTVDVAGNIYWDDANNQDGKRPAFVKVNLYANGEKIDSKTVAATINWTYNFKEMPTYKDGRLVTYTVTENEIDYYTITATGRNFTNTHIPEKLNIPVVAKFNISNPKLPLPENIIAELTNGIFASQNSEANTGQTVTLNDGNNWTSEFKDVYRYLDGKEVPYSLKVQPIDGYNINVYGTALDGFTIEVSSELPPAPPLPEETQVNSNISPTGDASSLGALSILAISAAFVVFKELRRKQKFN